MSKMAKLLEKYKGRTAKKPSCNTPSDSVSAPTGKAPAQATTPRAAPTPAAPPVSSKPVPEPVFEIEYITDPKKAEQVIEEEFGGGQPVGLDIETMKVPKYRDHPQAGLSPHLSEIRLIQLCQYPDWVYVFDVPKTGLEPLRPIFLKNLVAHNAVFEMQHLYHAGFETLLLNCTMLMHNALFNDLISLKALASKILGIDISKDEQTSDWGKPELGREQIHYAAMDAWLMQQIFPMLLSEIKKKDRQRIYEILQGAQSPVMKMMYHGCHFDATAHYLISEKNRGDLEKAEAKFRDILGPKVNLKSTKQLSDHYKKVLDERTLKAWPRTEKSGDLSFDKNTVGRFSHLKAVEPLAEFKKLSTLTSHFGESLREKINPATGRLHPEYKIANAVTGRFTCSKPNLQQIPKEKTYRALFNAPEGKKIIVADYSQVELRVLAMLSKDSIMLEAYRNGEDLHRLTASSMAGVSPEKVTAEQRRAAKPVNFGIIYGMKATSLVSYAWNNYGVKMTQQKAKENVKAFFDKYPGVARWGRKNYTDANLYKITRTKLGRVMKVTSVYTQSKNYPVQGSACEVMLAAMVEIDREICASDLDIKLVNIIHDEIVLEVAEEVADQAVHLLEKAMINGMLRVFPEAVTIGLVEAAIGDSWGEAK